MTMNLLIVTIVGLFVLWDLGVIALLHSIVTAPEGYENEVGFWSGSKA